MDTIEVSQGSDRWGFSRSKRRSDPHALQFDTNCGEAIGFGGSGVGCWVLGVGSIAPFLVERWANPYNFVSLFLPIGVGFDQSVHLF